MIEQYCPVGADSCYPFVPGEVEHVDAAPFLVCLPKVIGNRAGGDIMLLRAYPAAVIGKGNGHNAGPLSDYLGGPVVEYISDCDRAGTLSIVDLIIHFLPPISCTFFLSDLTHDPSEQPVLLSCPRDSWYIFIMLI